MRKLVMALAVSGVAASEGVHAQAVPAPRVAPPAAYEVAPPLAAYTDEILFGEVWRREGISPRDRSLVTLSALIANGRAAQLRGHLGRALDNGVTPAEISEVVAHLAFYAGWPVAISALPEVEAVFDQRGLRVPAVAAERLSLDEASEARRRASMQESTGAVAPPLADLTNWVLFGDLWRRPGLAPRDRSLVTVAALIANGQAE